MEKQVVELSLDDILPNRFQPRIKFNETSINELAESIKEHGVIQPIVVRRIGDKYEIIAGERRYKASGMAGKTTIPAIVTDLNDKDSAEVALIENVQRQNLTPIEEAISYKKILDMGYLTQEALAEKLGKTQSTIANKLRLLNLSDEVQEALLNEKISERHARSLLKINDQSKQNTLLDRIITERLTVRKTDEEIKNMLNNNANAEIIGFETPQEEPTNINIPTNSIVEDNSVYDPTPVEDIAPMPTVDVTNPGFVDVDKIENQAQDINVEKALNDIDALLKPSDILVSEPEIVPTVTPNANIFSNPSLNEVETPSTPVLEPQIDENNEEDAESILKPGKFFNLMEEETKEEESPVEVKPEPAISTTEEINKVPETVDFSQLVAKQEPETPSIPESPVEEPKEGPAQVDFSQFFTPIEPEPISFGEQIETPIVPETTVEDPKEESMPSLNPSFVETPIDFNRPMPTYEPIYDLEDDEPVLSELMKVEPSEQTGNGFRDVIKILRDSEQKIEQAGFVIEMEEFDFDDMYQVIFKIKK